MRKPWTKISLLALLFLVLVSAPASGQPLARPLMDVQDSTLFPATGDVIQVENDPYWWVAGDKAQGMRRLMDLPELGRLIYNMELGDNGLHGGASSDLEFSVNGELVQQFSVGEGDATAFFDVGFRTLMGPDYIFTLEQINTVAEGLGSIRIPLDQSGLFLFPPGPCPAATALSRADDTGRLDTMYRFRNELLASTPGMRERLEAYYIHAPEASSILRSHPLLLARTANLLRRALPAVEALLDGKGEEMSLSARDLRAAFRLLDDLAELASPELTTALLDLRGLIGQFKESTLTEGWSKITRS